MISIMDKAENDFYDERPSYYDQGSWMGYYTTIANNMGLEGNREDFGAYLPDPLEVRRRIATMRWLFSIGFNNRFVCSIMQYECPTIEVVRKLVEKYGPVEARRRLEPMLEKTEYDND